MKRLPLIALCFSSLLSSASALAEEARPEHDFSTNLGLVSDYRYRGISQSRLDPALQGGADYSHTPSGWYAGTWLSSIKWTRDAGGSGDVEWDLYGGKRGALSDAVSYDMGVLSYVYPGNGLDHVTGLANANTTELYLQLSAGPAYAKLSHSLTNLFGFVDSRGSDYLDLGANLELRSGTTLVLHAGHQSVRHNGDFSYSDWKIGLTQDAWGATFGLALLGTNANSALYVTPSGRFTGKTAAVLSVLKTF